MKQFIIVNAPVLIRAVLGVAKPFLPKKLRRRITSVKTGENLWKLVDPTQVPQSIGGTFDLNNDGRYPTTAWEYVSSMVVGDMPPFDLSAPVKTVLYCFDFCLPKIKKIYVCIYI